MRLLKFGSIPFLLLLGTLGLSVAQVPQSPAPAVADAPGIPAPPRPEPAAPPAPAPVTPAVAELRRDLADLVRGPGWRDARYGVLVVSLDRGDTLFALNPDLPLAPASNMKLYSTAAALYYLGPDFRFSTYVLGDGEMRDGVLDGDLILYGTGDPTFSRRMLDGSMVTFNALADSLVQRGVREVRGDIVGDGSFFDAEWIGRGWEDDDRMAWYAAPVGALSFAENMVSVRVLPGGTGEPARVRTSPATHGLAIRNEVRTVAGGRTSVRFEHGPEELVLSGQIARGHPGIARGLPIVDPANYATAAFRQVLEENGIQVQGELRTVRDEAASRVTLSSPAAPAADSPPRVLAAHLSPSLAQIAEVTNHISHNMFAEVLLKTVGRVALGEGTFEGGARAIRYMLECEAGLDSLSLGIVDGSGLSKQNRVTARSTIRLLAYMRHSEVWDAFYTSLPEAGRSDGLRRMYGTAAAGKLRAKTGTIQHVSALSGYVTAADGEQLAFSIIANDVPSTWRAKRTEDAIGARLASFRRPPEAAEPEVPVADTGPALEPDSAAAPADSPAAPPSASADERPRTHEIRSGDTLDGIARRYGTTVGELRNANPGLNPRRLQLGQEVRLPR